MYKTWKNILDFPVYIDWANQFHWSRGMEASFVSDTVTRVDFASYVYMAVQQSGTLSEYGE